MTRRTLILFLCVAFFAAACGTEQTARDTTTTEAPTATTTTTTTQTTSTTSPAPETTTTEVPADPADVAAIEEVYAVLFDSTTTFDEKAPFIDDPSGLEGTVAQYSATGASVGGVTADVTGVTVAGAEASVVYTLQFSGNPTYPNQQGTAVRNDGVWQVTRAMFCSVMASARSACPG